MFTNRFFIVLGVTLLFGNLSFLGILLEEIGTLQTAKTTQIREMENGQLDKCYNLYWTQKDTYEISKTTR